MTTGVLATPPILQFFDSRGNPLAGGSVLTQVGGVNAATYQDSALTTPLPNPITLNSRGEVSTAAGTSSQLFLTPNQVYTFSVSDANGNQVWVANYVSGVQLSATLANLATHYIGSYGSIQAAVNANSPNGYVIIDASYAGTDTYTNANNIPIIDLRNDQIGVWSVVAPGLGVQSGGNTYTQGNDLVLRAAGSGDIYLEHLHIATTTAQALAVGANASVLVGALNVGNAARGTIRTGTTALMANIATSVPLVVGRETANEEVVAAGSWSVVDGTHLSITCANTHAGTTDIEILGSTLLSSQDIFINAEAVKPSQQATSNPQLRVKDLHGSIVAKIPSDLQSPFPQALWQFAAVLSGYNGASQNLLLQHALTTSQIQFRSNTGATIGTLDNGGHLDVTNGLGAGTGSATLSGAGGEHQIGRGGTSAPSSTTDTFTLWQQGADPLNLGATAGSLGLFSRNLAGCNINLVTQSAVRVNVNAAATQPGADNAYTLGASAARWSVVYAATGTINTSDARQKEVVGSVPGLDLIERLRPVTYRWKVGGREIVGTKFYDENGAEIAAPTPGTPLPKGTRSVTIAQDTPGKREHFGLLAQDVKVALDELGLDAGLWTLADKSDPESAQGLRYEQLIPSLVMAIQQLSAQVKALKAKTP